MVRKLLITGVAVKMKFESRIDSNTFEKYHQQFKGMIQLDIVSSGDFSGLTVESLETLIINCFKANPNITIQDFIRTVN